MRRLGLFILIASLTALEVGAARAENAKDNAVGLDLFEKRIRPVLVKHCYKCHSADAKKPEAGLLLDTRAGIRRGGESGAAVAPGKVKDSLIISALEHDDFEMPPKKKLPDAVIADFRRWIELGAPDPRDGEVTTPIASEIDIENGRTFWSFQPPEKHAPPQVKNAAWPRGDIDRFILAKIEGAALVPAADADRETLIRRATFALVGLPPTPEEIDAFVADKSTDAFANVVDRLLASAHFGERWARHWLDVARYAESSGGGRTLIFPNAWRYRDYVIRSFNADKPFNQFLMEQIAGDLMKHKSTDEKNQRQIATGFLALGPTNFELQDKELLRMEVIDEQLDTIGRSMLGMTVGCARCHDHKFDPLPTRDYYALAGILGSVKTFSLGNVASPVRVAISSPAEEKAVASYNDQVAKLNAQIAQLDKQFKQLAATAGGGKPTQGNIVRKQPAGVDIAKLAGVVVDNSKAKLVGQWKQSTFSSGFLGSEYLHDENTGKGKKSITFAARLPSDGSYEVRISYTASSNREKRVPVTVHHAAGKTSSRLDQTERPPIDGTFASLGTFRFTAAQDAAVEIANIGTRQYVIADAVQFLPQPSAESRDADKPSLKKAKASATEVKVIADEIAAAKKKMPAVKKQLDALRKQLAQLKKKAPKPSNQALSVLEDKPRDGHLHIRGGVRNLGPVVPRGVMQVATYGSAPEIPKNESGRLQLAEWIASEKNPLTARVMANRVWHHLLGEGLVRTPDNFGAMGERPSHPELLDHLALQFVQNGWSVKKLIREIMLTRTYQLSSQPSKAALAIDLENRLLARAHLRRVDAEAIRDAVLVVSGKLDRTAFGPTMKKGTGSELNYKFASVRRSVYVPSFRNTQLDLLSVFDVANPNVVTGRRTASTLPTQALLLMNSPSVIEQSRYAAERLIAETPGADDATRIDLLFRRALGRRPRAAEAERLMAYLNEQREKKKTPTDAWARVCQTVFACVDFRYVR